MAINAIGLKVRARRKSLGVTQSDLAKQVGVSASYLNLIESGKRGVGGKLLVALARALETDLEALDGADARRIIGALAEAAADPVVREAHPNASDAAELTGRFPDWARALALLHRAYLDRDRVAAALSDRLNQDQVLTDGLHQMLSHVSAISSASEILQDAPRMGARDVARFHRILADESGRLSEVSLSLARFFDQTEAKTLSTTPAEEVDDLIEHHHNHFPTLEAAAETLRAEIGAPDPARRDQLIERLDAWRRAHADGRRDPSEDDAFDARAPGDHAVAAGSPEAMTAEERPETVRFHAARAAMGLCAEEAVAALTDSNRFLRTEVARRRARRALTAYAAAAFLTPYETFLQDAETLRYDVQALRRKHRISYEQAAHRLATLRRTGAEGVPFGFMRADPAGHVTKRLSLPGLPLPRHGGGCPLWTVYRAFQTPEQVVRQMVELPTGERFFFVARALAKGSGAFDRPRRLLSVLLACDAAHAERLVYADGLAIGPRAVPEPVGVTCRLCSRQNCAARQEEELIAG